MASYEQILAKWEQVLDLFALKNTVVPATKDKAGLVRPDGYSISVASDGLIAVVRKDAIESTGDLSVTGKAVYNYVNPNYVHLTGSVSETVTGNKTFAGSITFSQETNGVAFNTSQGDLAEKYVADNQYVPGTLIRFGGSEQITVASNGIANGVVSSNPGLTMNNQADGISVAMIGQVPVRVVGPVKKFDGIVASLKYDGVGEVGDQNIVGRALEDNSDVNEKLVNCTVLFHL